MGHGAARELEGAAGPLPELSPELAARLTTVLDALDAKDPAFKDARDEERLGLLVKTWNGVCREIDDHLRVCGKLLVVSHQLNLDVGSDGGGLGQKPFIEDLRQKFKKLQFKLNPDDSHVEAFSGEVPVGRGHVEKVDFDWVISMVVEWVVKSAAKL